MNLAPFRGLGSTPSRRRFWDEARDAVMSAQKVAGRNVTVDEHPGKGSVINVAESSTRRGGGGGGATGACCKDGDCTITTAAGCASIDGTYQGDGTICESVDCGEATSGACCVGSICSIRTPSECAGLGGTYLGDNTTCDDDPCGTGDEGACCKDGDCTVETEAACLVEGGTYLGDGTVCLEDTCACSCGFDAFDMSGRKFTRYQRTISGSLHAEQQNGCDPPDNADVIEDTTCSAFFESHFEAGSIPPCSAIIDVDTSSSTADITVNGVSTFSCSRGDIECFCSSSAPNNACDGGTFFGETTNCGCTESSPSADPTATTRTTTWTFSQDCSIDCVACPDCTLHCTVSGSYVVTEILSEECIPI